MTVFAAAANDSVLVIAPTVTLIESTPSVPSSRFHAPFVTWPSSIVTERPEYLGRPVVLELIISEMSIFTPRLSPSPSSTTTRPNTVPGCRCLEHAALRLDRSSPNASSQGTD